MRNRTIYLILSFFLITLFSGVIFAASQQILRFLGDDPQIQIVQDVTTSLNAGADPTQLSPTQLDIKTSVAPFVIIFDKNGKAVAASGQLDKKTPVPAKDVFDKAKSNGQSRFTWEPAKGVRHAAVMASYDKGFVLAARSLRQTDERAMIVLKLVGLGWILGLGATVAAFMLTGGLPIAFPKLNIPSKSPASASSTAPKAVRKPRKKASSKS